MGAPAGVLGHLDPGEELALTDSRLEQVTEEVTGCHGPLAARPDDDELGIEGERRGTDVTRRVGADERTAHRAAVADLRVGHLLDGLGQQCCVLADGVAGEHVGVRGHRADDHGRPRR